MNTFIEITREAFEAIAGEANSIPENAPTTYARTQWYIAKGVTLKTITNFYSRPITQYYIRDINA